MDKEKDDLSWSFQREVRYNQMNTNNLIFLKTMMEINFLKFILYRKLFRIQRAWDTGYMGIGSDAPDSFNPKIVEEWEEAIPKILVEITKWVEMLKTVPNIKPRDDFFNDIYVIKDDADWNNSDIDKIYDELLKVTEEYRLIVNGS